MFAFAFTSDPLTHHNLGPGNPYEGFCRITKTLKLIATRNEDNTNPEAFIKKFQAYTNLNGNAVFMLEKHGDIMYF
jgi:hypothetical protein